MRKIDKMRIITTTYNKLHEVSDSSELKALNLTLTEYYVACDCMLNLGTPGNSTKTFLFNVAEFFKSNGFKIKLSEANYIISI